MKIISHRGNYHGIFPEKENKPSYIDTTLSIGYDVEVDIRFIDNSFYLGHDTPETKIETSWILNRKDKLWFHCKNLDAAMQFKKMDCGIKYFCHSSDDFVLISTGHIWVHNLNLGLDSNCIIPLLNKEDIENYNSNDVYAICTDDVNIILSKIKNEICK